jgi:DNA gyrase subunit B
VSAFISYLNTNKTPLNRKVFHFTTGARVASASKWPCSGMTPIRNRSTALPTTFRSGMAAPTWPGFRTALTRTLNNYMEQEACLKKDKVAASGDDSVKA